MDNFTTRSAIEAPASVRATIPAPNAYAEDGSANRSWHWQSSDPLGPLFTRFPFRILARDQVGLDMGSRWIKYAVVRHGIGASRLLAAGGVPVLGHSKGQMGKIRAQIAALLTIRERIARQNQRWVVGISGTGTMVRTVEVPRMPSRELRNAILWQAQKKFPFSLEDAHVAIRLVKTPSDQPVRAIVAAALKRLVDDFLYLLAEAEIRPSALTLPAFGMAEGLHSTKTASAGEFNGVIDIGGERSFLAVYRGLQIEFFRELDFGTGDLEHVAVHREVFRDPADPERTFVSHEQQTGSGPADAKTHEAGDQETALEKLILEVQSTLEYYAAQAGGLKINQFFLLGGGAMMPGLTDQLSQALELPVCVLHPEAVKHLADSETLQSPALWTGAYGYALLPRSSANLLPIDFLRQQEQQFQTLVWRTATGTAVAASLLVTGAEYYRAGHSRYQTVEFEKQIATTSAQLDAIGIQNIEATLAANRRWLAAVTRPDVDAGVVLRTLAAATPLTIALDRVDVQPSDSATASIAISGEVRTEHAQNEVVLADYVERLRATGVMHHVTLASYTTQRKPEYEHILFSLLLKADLGAHR
jgi:type IV pilus assembly protein PilM